MREITGKLHDSIVLPINAAGAGKLVLSTWNYNRTREFQSSTSVRQVAEKIAVSICSPHRASGAATRWNRRLDPADAPPDRSVHRHRDRGRLAPESWFRWTDAPRPATLPANTPEDVSPHPEAGPRISRVRFAEALEADT